MAVEWNLADAISIFSSKNCIYTVALSSCNEIVQLQRIFKTIKQALNLIIAKFIG